MSRKPLAIVLHGPSGVGKDTVIEQLRRKTGIHRATSTTSRTPRSDERDGIDYHFISRDEFEQKAANGEFAEHANVYGDWKGLEKREIEGPLRDGQDVFIRTDVQGARTWRKKLDGAVTVCLVAEAPDVLRRRLKERGSEDDASLRRREAELEAELADLPNNDYVVVNQHGRVDETVDELVRIIEAERANPKRPVPRLRDGG